MLAYDEERRKTTRLIGKVAELNGESYLIQPSDASDRAKTRSSRQYQCQAFHWW